MIECYRSCVSIVVNDIASQCCVVTVNRQARAVNVGVPIFSLVVYNIVFDDVVLSAACPDAASDDVMDVAASYGDVVAVLKLDGK